MKTKQLNLIEAGPTLIAVVCLVGLSLSASSFASVPVIDNSLQFWISANDDNGDATANAPSGGTLWGDLTAGNNNVTLTNFGTGTVPAWGGSGTLADPYYVRFDYVNNSNGGYGRLANSGAGSNLDTQGPYTLEVWAKRNGEGSAGGGGRIIGNMRSPSNGSASLDYYGNELFYAIGGGGGPIPNSTNDFSTSAFVHLVFVHGTPPSPYSGATSFYYADGVLQSSFTANSDDGGDPFTIGGRQYGSAIDTFLKMDLAAARFYTRALSGAEVGQNFNAGLAALPEPTSATLLALGGLLFLRRTRRME